MRSTSLFRSLEEMCGLNHEECASYLGFSLNSVESWASGTLDAPPTAVKKLIHLWNNIEDAASRIVDEIEVRITNTLPGKFPEFAELEVPTSLEDANGLGWPSVGTFLRIAALVAANIGVKLQLVPQQASGNIRISLPTMGSTESDIHEVLLKLAKYGGRSYPTQKIPNGIAFNDVEACSDSLVAFWQTADGVNPIFQERVDIDGERFIVVSAEVLP